MKNEFNEIYSISKVTLFMYLHESHLKFLILDSPVDAGTNCFQSSKCEQIIGNLR